MPDDRRPASYWEYDAARPLDCRACGWSGTTTAEDHDAFLDVRCPACDASLLKLPWPSTEETRAAAEAGNARAARDLATRLEVEARWARAARSDLTDPAQLPAIDADRITIAWDFEQTAGAGPEAGPGEPARETGTGGPGEPAPETTPSHGEGTAARESWTVLRHEGREIFRELAYWEGIDRFVEVVAVLERAYGERLRAVQPTGESEMYLWGDRLGAPRTIDGINARLAREPRRGRFGRRWSEPSE